MGKRHKKDKLSDKDLSKVAGGAAIPRASDIVERVHAVQQTTVAQHPATLTTSQHQTHPDAFRSDAFVPAQHQPRPTHAERLYAVNEEIRRTVSQITPTPLALPSPNAIPAHLKTLERLSAQLDEHSTLLGPDNALDGKQKEVLLRQIARFKAQIAVETTALQRRQAQLAVVGNLEQLASQMNKDASAQTIAEGVNRLIPRLGTEQLDKLSPQERDQLSKARKTLVEQIKKSAEAAMGDSQKALRSTVKALSEITIPLGGDSPEVRFRQARYMDEVDAFNTKAANASRFKLQVEELEKELASAQKAGDKNRVTELEGQVRAKRAQLKTVSEKHKAMEENFKKDRDAGKARASAASMMPIFGGIPTFLFAEVNLLATYGLEPTSVEVVANRTLYSTVKMLTDVASQKEPGVHYVNVPGHVMLIAIDPARRSYRLFDPNFGVFQYHDPQTFAEQTAAYINQSYNKSKFSPTDPSTQDGKVSWPTLDLKGAPVEMRLAQSDPSVGGMELGHGVCAALSSHMAQWLLEHPDAEGPLTAERVGLSSWNMRKLVTEDAERLARNGQYMEAMNAWARLVVQSNNPEAKGIVNVVLSPGGTLTEPELEKMISMFSKRAEAAPTDQGWQGVLKLLLTIKESRAQELAAKRRLAKTMAGIAERLTQSGQYWNAAAAWSDVVDRAGNAEAVQRLNDLDYLTRPAGYTGDAEFKSLLATVAERAKSTNDIGWMALHQLLLVEQTSADQSPAAKQKQLKLLQEHAESLSRSGEHEEAMNLWAEVVRLMGNQDTKTSFANLRADGGGTAIGSHIYFKDYLAESAKRAKELPDDPARDAIHKYLLAAQAAYEKPSVAKQKILKQFATDAARFSRNGEHDRAMNAWGEVVARSNNERAIATFELVKRHGEALATDPGFDSLLATTAKQNEANPNNSGFLGIYQYLLSTQAAHKEVQAKKAAAAALAKGKAALAEPGFFISLARLRQQRPKKMD